MKHLSLRIYAASFMMSIAVIGVNAQDTMVTKSGDIKTVYGVEISASAVFYKSSCATDAQIERIAKDDLFMIKRPDGTMYDLGNSVEPAATAAPVPESSAREPLPAPENDVVSEEAMKLNQRLIAKYNSATPTITGKEGKDVSRVFCTLGVREESQMVNDDIELNIRTGYGSLVSCVQGMTGLEIKNRTNKTLYIDLGNSFFISGGTAYPYYIPTAQSTSSTSSSGASVNAGAVAGALGIGGGIGKLAGGVNVGGGSSSTSVNVVYSQRVVAIPPLSSIKLDKKILVSKEANFGDFISFQVWGKEWITRVHVDHEYASGESYTIAPEESPANFSFFVTYSPSEDCLETKSMRVDLYTRHILGYRYNSGNCMTLLETNGAIGFPAKTVIEKKSGNNLVKTLIGVRGR